VKKCDDDAESWGIPHPSLEGPSLAVKEERCFDQLEVKVRLIRSRFVILS